MISYGVKAFSLRAFRLGTRLGRQQLCSAVASTHLTVCKKPFVSQLQRRYTSTWKFELADDHLKIPASSGGTKKLSIPYSWLRDHCPCELCVHPSTRQKLHSGADVQENIRPKKVEYLDAGSAAEGGGAAYKITWSGSGLDRVDLLAAKIAKTQDENKQDHVTTVSAQYLAEHFDPSPNVSRFQLHPTPVFWDTKTVVGDAQAVGKRENWISYAEYMDESNTGLLRALRTLGQYGLVFLTGVPADVKSTEAVANRIGRIRDTFYGRTWDVKSVPNAKNIAYTPLHLGLHMDLLYFEAPPGLQFLHCYKHSVKGGASTFLDSFTVVELLRKHYPEDFEVLRRTPVTFHYVNDGHHMHYRRPTIITPSSSKSNGSDVVAGNEPLIVNYAPPFQGPLEGLSSVKEGVAFYRAFRRFTAIMEGTDRSVWESLPSSGSSSSASVKEGENPLLFTTTLRPGDLTIFANRRVLHGRTSFDPSTGERHLKGTYVDGDDFRDRWRVLEKQVGGKKV